MSDQHAATAEGHPAMDYAEHEKTYKRFLSFVKYGMIVIILLVITLAVVTL